MKPSFPIDETDRVTPSVRDGGVRSVSTSSRVLLVTYHFPPSGGIGPQRALSYCKYLVRLGHDVLVLAPRRTLTHVYDPQLLNTVPSEVRILRALNPEVPYAWRGVARRMAGRSAALVKTKSVKKTSGLPSLAGRLMEWISFPDPQKTWAPFAIRKAADAIRRHRIDTVIITVPPFSSLRIGIEIKRRFPAVRLINDFRDEWIAYTLVEHRGGAGEFTVTKAIAAEKEAVEAADFTIAVTEPWLSLIRRRNPDQPAEKFLCIPNGYDPEELPAKASNVPATGNLVVCYTGTIDSTPVYSAKKFFEAVAGLPAVVRNRLEIWVVGRVEKSEAEFMDRAGANVQRFGFLPRPQALDRLAKADCALLLVNTRDAHSGKLFEYMALGKPILALSVPGGEIDRLVARINAGWCVNGNSVADIRSALERLAALKQRGPEAWPQPDSEAIRAYERPRLIKEMTIRTGISRPAHARLV